MSLLPNQAPVSYLPPADLLCHLSLASLNQHIYMQIIIHCQILKGKDHEE